ncbi:MAG: DUF481 domain-containing protein [Bacteroidetes bacterium]|nr:MAG: DUF481 domain-containing protein [Bacteroidota bacterium]
MRPTRPFDLLFILCLLCTATAQAQIVNIEEQRITGTDDTTHWYGYLRGSASLVKVRDQSLRLSGQSKVQFKQEPHLALLLLNLNLLRAGNNDFAKQAFAHLRYNYKIREALTWEAFGQVQTSPLQLLHQRWLAGTGPRWRLLKSRDGRQRIYLGTAWLWEHNIFSDDNGEQFWNRSSNYLSCTFRVGKQATLITTTYWQPVWGRISNYRLSSEWLLRINLTRRVSLTVDFTYSIDENLPPDAPKETYIWQNGISLQL